MEGSAEDFNEKVIAAVEAKAAWFDSFQLPKIQDDYRLHLTCINNIYDALAKRGLIVPDPYAKDKKISAIVCPDDDTFNDNERAAKLGLRMSDYKGMIDFICNYMKFSVDQLSLDKITKLLKLNETFHWANLSPNSAKINTRSLANCLVELRSGAPQLQAAMLNDSLSKTKTALEEINKTLKALGDFQKERYKAQVRGAVMKSDKFDASKRTDANALRSEIRKLMPSLLPRRPVVNELIEEIVREETDPGRAQIQAQVLQKFQISEDRVEKGAPEVDTHEMLMAAVSTIATASEQYNVILERLRMNSNTLSDATNTGGQKFRRFLRKIFGLPDPEVEYNISIEDTTTKQSRKEKLNFSEFTANLAKRSKYYSAITVKHSPGYNKVNAQPDGPLLEFLNKQLVDNSRLLSVLAGLDLYFKGSVPPSVRSKIKGITMELTTIKNILVKTNQQKAEYVGLVEEQEQMKKLGIAHE